jgi:hypothetical protein
VKRETNNFASFAERVSDCLLPRQSRAGLLIGAPRDVAEARPGGGQVITFEAVIDLLVERSWRVPQGVGSASQSRRSLVAALYGSDGGDPGEAFADFLNEYVLGAQPQPPLKRLAGPVEVT